MSIKINDPKDSRFSVSEEDMRNEAARQAQMDASKRGPLMSGLFDAYNPFEVAYNHWAGHRIYRSQSVQVKEVIKEAVCWDITDERKLLT